MMLDPFGVLGPNEIQIKASGPKFLRDTGYYAHEIIGDVVVSAPSCQPFIDLMFPSR